MSSFSIISMNHTNVPAAIVIDELWLWMWIQELKFNFVAIEFNRELSSCDCDCNSKSWNSISGVEIKFQELQLWDEIERKCEVTNWYFEKP
jgi:hypothetical protein